MFTATLIRYELFITDGSVNKLKTRRDKRIVITSNKALIVRNTAHSRLFLVIADVTHCFKCVGLRE